MLTVSKLHYDSNTANHHKTKLLYLQYKNIPHKDKTFCAT